MRISLENGNKLQAQIESIKIRMANCFNCDSNPETNDIIFCDGCSELNKELRRLEVVVKE